MRTMPVRLNVLRRWRTSGLMYHLQSRMIKAWPRQRTSKDKTDAFAKDVKDAIKDELDVTDEQIEKSHGRSGITIS